MNPSSPAPAAFRTLERALTRRRFAGVDARLRVELAALCALISAFLFWQARIPLDGLERAHGPIAVAKLELLLLASFVAIGGMLAGIRHSARLRGGTRGPAWLALPAPSAVLERHLLWDSRLSAWILLVPGIACLVAAIGLVAPGWLALFAGIFVWLLFESARLGCRIAHRIVEREAEPRAGLDALTRVLVAARRAVSVAQLPAARWRRRAAWLALCAKDLTLSRRATPARQRAITPLILLALSALVWAFPIAPPLARALAFAFSLLAATAFAEWIISAAGTDPFSVLRTLPVGVAVVWGARVAFAAAGAALLVAVQAACARPLAPPALRFHLVWIGAAALAIGVLGANYAITLYPRAEHAQRVLALSLALAIAASLMIPLVGWVLVFTALLHSARRLPRWTRQEIA